MIASKPLGFHILSLRNSCCHRNIVQFVQSPISSDTQWMETFWTSWFSALSLSPTPTASPQGNIFVSALFLWPSYGSPQERNLSDCLMPASFSLKFTQIRKPQTFPLHQRHLNLSKYVQLILYLVSKNKSRYTSRGIKEERDAQLISYILYV